MEHQTEPIFIIALFCAKSYHWLECVPVVKKWRNLQVSTTKYWISIFMHQNVKNKSSWSTHTIHLTLVRLLWHRTVRFFKNTIITFYTGTGTTKFFPFIFETYGTGKEYRYTGTIHFPGIIWKLVPLPY